ncbi:MAG TPA: hypothetical protein VFW94_23615 [Candidatus Acidoferrales bacterium]|nr:hypothetical protein [Candidatus Acidoferrales bacterium]
MAYRTFFLFAAGLAETLQVPRGTKAAIMAHVEEIESTLGLKRTKFRDNPQHWDHFDENYRKGFPNIDEEILCETISNHNAWVREMYDKFAHWSEHPFKRGKGHQAEHCVDSGYPVGWRSEKLSPRDAKRFWHALEFLKVPVERWSMDYYRERMEHLYEVMRGRESEGVTFDMKPLTPRQAAEVIILFAEYLDDHDLRLDVPNDRDYLASSYDGGYQWCEKCGPVAEGDEDICKKRGCPIRAERKAAGY